MENNYEFNLSDVDLYLNGNLVLEASAGTGKTFSIQKMVKNLVKNNVDINKVLIVTYTEKATGELKNRIREELSKDVASNDLDNLNIYTIHSFCQNAIREFGLDANQPLALNVIDEATILSNFIDAYIRDNEEIKQVISEAYAHPDCNSMLNVDTFKKTLSKAIQVYYLKKDYSPDESIISFDEKNKLETLEFILKHPICFDSFYEDYPGFKDNYDILDRVDNIDIKLSLFYIKSTFENRSIALGKEKFLSSFSFNDSDQEAINALNEYIDELKAGGDNARISTTCKTFDELISSNQRLGDIYWTLSNSSNYASKYIAVSLKEKSSYKKRSSEFEINYAKKIKFFPIKSDSLGEEEHNALEFFNKFLTTFNEFSMNEAFVLSCLGKVYEEWQKYKQENKMQTYNDMLRTIREELVNGNEAFKNKLKEKYQYAIIDEFQDTNQLQFDTFKSIFLEDNDHHMIVVGDPKQSIYSFQGADLNVYQKACDELIQSHGASKRMLLTNYRSTDKMIDACNSFFQDQNNKKFFLNQEFCTSASTGKQNATYNGEDTEAIWVATARTEDGKPEGILPDDYPAIICNFILDACSKTQNGDTKLQVYDKKRNALRSVSFRDFTILCKQRSETKDLTRLLSKNKIPFVKYKDTGLFKTKECFHWATLLEAIIEVDFTGSRRKSLKRALASKFFGYTLEELNSSYFNHDDIDEVRLINKWKEMAKNKEWEKLIESIMLDSNLYNNLKNLDKLQSFTLYKQLGEYCLSYLYENHTLEDLAYKLRNNPSDDEDDEDSGIVEIGTDFDAVKIMTIHAAKGLQYPVVISVAGWQTPKGHIPVVYHDDENQFKRRISFNSNKASKDEEAEYKRLIYVAYTRAESLMMIPCYFYEEKSTNKNAWLAKWTRGFMDNEENNNSFKKVFRRDFSTHDTADEMLENSIENIDHTSYQYAQIKGLSEKKSYKSSYSSLSHGEVIKEEEFDDEQKDLENPINNDFNLTEYDMNACQMKSNVDSSILHEAYEGIPKGSTIGTALHEIFERIDFTNYKHNLDEIIKDRLIANRIKVEDRILDYIHKMMDNVLNALLPELDGTSFKLSEISMDNRKAEIEFNFNLKKEYFKNYCNGFIDLLFRRGNKYYILDWKSDTLNDEFLSYSDLDELKKHTDKLYSIQRVLYSYCLIKWLEPLLNKNEEEIFKNYFGGIYYVYIRGCNMSTGNGIYAQKWNSYKELEDAFNMIIDKKIGW